MRVLVYLFMLLFCCFLWAYAEVETLTMTNLTYRFCSLFLTRILSVQLNTLMQRRLRCGCIWLPRLAMFVPSIN